MELWNDIINMVKEPFIGSVDLQQLFLLVGAVLIILAIWAFILYKGVPLIWKTTEEIV